MLVDGRCSIYEHRPRTCRTYDCRIFTATGLDVGANDYVTKPISGDDVFALQERLLELGFDAGRPDGIFGRETEQALRAKLPKRYWITFNDLLVPYGQNLCQPVSPFCSRCKRWEMCDRVGVTRSR